MVVDMSCLKSAVTFLSKKSAFESSKLRLSGISFDCNFNRVNHVVQASCTLVDSFMLNEPRHEKLVFWSL